MPVREDSQITLARQHIICNSKKERGALAISFCCTFSLRKQISYSPGFHVRQMFDKASESTIEE
jgi:hypothetical protein